MAAEQVDPITGLSLRLPSWGGGSEVTNQQPYWYPSTSQINSGSFNRNIYGGAQSIPNPMYFNAGQGGFSNNSNITPNTGGGSRTQFSSGGSMGSFQDIMNRVFGGGDINFQGNTPEGFNPYQYTPAVQNLQRPDRFVLPLTDQEEFLRQYGLGNLLGNRPGEQLASSELMRTVGGDYLNPSTNPYLGMQFNALGNEATDQLNEMINSILSRAGTSGALGGSRSALMQGQAGGEASRAFNQTVADLLQQNYQAERGRQLSSIPGLLGVEQLPTERINQAMGLAGMPRGLEQQELSARIQELLRQQGERLLPLQVGQSTLGQLMGQTIPIMNPGSNLSGLGSLITGGANALSSLGGPLANMGNNAWQGIQSLSNLFGGGNPAMSSFGGLMPEMSQPSDLGGLFEFGASSGLGGL